MEILIVEEDDQLGEVIARGLATEGRSWLERAAGPVEEVAPAVRARALMWASPLALMHRDREGTGSAGGWGRLRSGSCAVSEYPE